MDLTGVVEMSRRYGGDQELVLAGGGNTSVKTADTLYVKCSGTGLATIDEEGFVPVDRHALAQTMVRDYPEDDKGREAAFLQDVMDARVIEGETRRPSVEALLHSLFPQTYVLHLHPALVNGLTCAVAGEENMHKLYGDDALWIPATRPGYILGSVCSREMTKYRERTGRDVQVVFLQNHGIFVAADTVEEIDTVFGGVMEKLRAAVSTHPDFTPEGVLDGGVLEMIRAESGMKSARFGGCAEILRLAESRETAGPVLKPFTPDHIVYCGPFPLYLERAEEIRQVKPTGKIVLVRGVGFFALGQSDKEAETAAQLFKDGVKIAVYAQSFGGPKHMTDDLTDFIVNWEAESYRKKQS